MKILILPIQIDNLNRFVSFYVDSKEQKLITLNFENNHDDNNFSNLKNVIHRLSFNKDENSVYFIDNFNNEKETIYFFAVDIKKIKSTIKTDPDELLEIKVNEFNEIRDLETQYAVLKTMYIILKK